MKRMILSAALVLLVAGGIQAQTTQHQTTHKEVRTTKVKKAKTRKAPKTKALKVTSDSLNDRRMYKASNGQAATPTGHQATGTGEGYSSIKKRHGLYTTERHHKTKKGKRPIG